MKLLDRRRALMAANKGPTQGLVNGSYYNGQIVVTNNNTITVTSKSSSAFWCKIPLISPITPTGSCYSYLMLDNGSSAGTYAKLATYDASTLIAQYGSNPAYWTGRDVYYVAPYIGNVATTFKLTVVNNGHTVF